MKKTIFAFCFALAFSFNIEACPYQKMAEVDSKLYSKENKINTQTFAKVSNLRMKGEENLELVNLTTQKRYLTEL